MKYKGQRLVFASKLSGVERNPARATMRLISMVLLFREAALIGLSRLTTQGQRRQRAIRISVEPPTAGKNRTMVPQRPRRDGKSKSVTSTAKRRPLHSGRRLPGAGRVLDLGPIVRRGAVF